MKKLRLQHYILLILSILTLSLACSAYVFMYKDAVTKAEEESLVRTESAAASKHVLQIKDMQTTYQDTVQDRAALPSFLVSADDAVPFIDAVEAIGPATGSTLSISSLSSGTDSSTSHGVVTASVSVKGDWANVMRAVEMIESMPYALTVKSLDLNASSDSSSKSPSSWSASLDVSVLSSL